MTWQDACEASGNLTAMRTNQGGNVVFRYPDGRGDIQVFDDHGPIGSVEADDLDLDGYEDWEPL
jgi:hypothetical protein